MRVNLSVALVAMVNQTGHKEENVSYECPQDSNGSTVNTDSTGDFNWSPSLQGTILGAFFYGYVVTQIPGGYLSGRFGGKYFFGLGVLTTGILTLLTPLAAKTNVYLFIVLRVLEGIGEGVTYPTMHAMMGKWAPPLERSRLLSVAYAGGQIGTAVSMPITGYLCKYGFAGGWPSVFYVFGSFACVWFIFWMLLVYDSPSVHPWISEEEKVYIISSIGDPVTKKHESVPWCGILTSVSVWSMCAAHFGGSYIFYTLLTDLPTYLDVVLHFDLKQDGLLSALPYILNFIVNLLSGLLTDLLLTKQVWRVTTARKVNTAFALLLPAACMFGASFMGCDYYIGVGLLSLSTGLLGSGTAGFVASVVDVAPRFAGSTMGFVNMMGNVTGIVAPLVVGLLTNNNNTQAQWNKVFYIASSVSVLGAIVYVLFGKAEREPWGYGKDDKLITESMATPHETPGPAPLDPQRPSWDNSSEVLSRRASPLKIN
ncbi:sialin-like isoform X2 [Lineus longissimus]